MLLWVTIEKQIMFLNITITNSFMAGAWISIARIEVDVMRDDENHIKYLNLNESSCTFTSY